MPAVPFRTESVSYDEAQRKLRSMEARLHKTSPRGHVFWAPGSKVWLLVSRTATGYRLSYYKSKACPC